MAEWSVAQVCEWVTQLELPPGCAETVGRIFADCDFDGDELRDIKPKTLRRLLTTAGMPDPTLAVEAILNQRDVALSNGKAAVAPNECPCCFEVYRDDGDGSHVPRMLPCGHTGCHGCFALMLRPLQPSADRSGKPLVCPVCRVVTVVKDGQASSLPKNFSLLR